MATSSEIREHKEPCEHLEAEQADETYMADLYHLYLERVRGERRQYELYKAGQR